MEPINEKAKTIRLGKLEIEPYFSFLSGVGLGIMIGEGVYYHSVRVEITLLVLYFGVHFIWDNPVPEGFVQ
jgi:hypothetical protein